MGNRNKLPSVFEPDHLIKLFDAMVRPKVAMAAFIAFFCGLRISEVCNLLIVNVDLNRKVLKIEDSKNPKRGVQGYGKDRYVPIPDQVIGPIKKWMQIIDDGKYLFPSDKSPNSPFRKKSLDEQYRHTLKMAGLLIPDYVIEFDTKINGKTVHKKVTKHKYKFHTLRHSYATYLRNKGVGIDIIKELLGHERYDTTLIYAKISQESKTKAINEAFNVQMRQQYMPPEEVRRYKLPEPNQSPENYLKMQLIRGEISAEDFVQKKKLLEG